MRSVAPANCALVAAAVYLTPPRFLIRCDMATSRRHMNTRFVIISRQRVIVEVQSAALEVILNVALDRRRRCTPAFGHVDARRILLGVHTDTDGHEDDDEQEEETEVLRRAEKHRERGV